MEQEVSEAREADANLAEIRRLQTELSGVRDELAQRDRAIVAAHQAIETARADAAAWIAFVREASYQLEHGAKIAEIQSDLYEAYYCAVQGNAPGAALLTELDAAQAVIDAARRALNECPFCRVERCRAEAHEWLRTALGAYDRGVKARQL